MQALLNSGQVARCDLYTIRLPSFAEYRYTNADVAISAGGRNFVHDGPEIHGARMRQSRGLDPDEQRLTVLVKPEHTIGGVSWLTALRSGALDEAEVVIEKAFLADWGAPAHALEWFRGTVQEASGDDLAIQLAVESDSARFGQMLPRELFGPGCVRDLFDAGCGVNKAAYRVDAAVTGGNRARIHTTLNRPAEWFSRGYLVFTSGPNSGVRRSVVRSEAVNGALEFSMPLVFDPRPGDAFMAWPGCDKTAETCGAKYNNRPRFKATPYVPVPETVL
ncbi:DUF2163 domain-containing protein [Cupriavidus malaysiensis]|uniref:Bacteriophage phiJL001 Gp84 C-terminal domain-containing protein n=1 Tax=Cupriavidus malaysiensis TaxID=367825 RepID=A0ABM6F3K8_9BURK|nr:DUF2163 domain-containing protein [Cupriavidus malaysiensis]AOZ05968.1 hypothetical protein BKK80_09100 [Cupriavidus malaysiensis]